MAFARDVSIATGGQTDFTISFPYQAEEDVLVIQNGTTLTQTTHYTFHNATTIRLVTGATAGDTVVRQRSTSQSSRDVDFTAGTLTEADLDNSALQVFYMAQEAIDIANNALVKGSDEIWDATSIRIKNVADPTEDQDAATKAFVDAATLAAFGTPLGVANGGTGGSTAAAARTGLGLEIGTDVQAELDVPSQAEAEAGTATNERVWTAQRVSQAIAALATSGLPKNYLTGLAMSNDTDADHDIAVAVGEARDSADAVDMALASIMTKRIDATWSAGDDAGGLSSSLTAPANNTWYHVHLIVVSGSVDVGFDTSITAANLVADHSATAYRRIGSVLTDGSANILPFIQTDDNVQWDAPIVDVDVIGPGTSAVLRTMSSPLGVKCEAFGVALMENENGVGNGSTILTDPDTADTSPATGNTLGTTNLNTANTAVQFRVMTNTSSQIRSRSIETGTNVGLELDTFGYVDRRGRG